MKYIPCGKEMNLIPPVWMFRKRLEMQWFFRQKPLQNERNLCKVNIKLVGPVEKERVQSAEPDMP